MPTFSAQHQKECKMKNANSHLSDVGKSLLVLAIGFILFVMAVLVAMVIMDKFELVANAHPAAITVPPSTPSVRHLTVTKQIPSAPAIVPSPWAENDVAEFIYPTNTPTTGIVLHYGNEDGKEIYTTYFPTNQFLATNNHYYVLLTNMDKRKPIYCYGATYVTNMEPIVTIETNIDGSLSTNLSYVTESVITPEAFYIPTWCAPFATVTNNHLHIMGYGRTGMDYTLSVPIKVLTKTGWLGQLQTQGSNAIYDIDEGKTNQQKFFVRVISSPAPKIGPNPPSGN